MVGATRVRPSTATRRVGFAIAALVNAVLLYVINIRPGWRALPLLTEDASKVIGLVNLSLLIGLTVNVAYLIYAAAWFKSLGDVLTTAVGLAVLIRLWQVFPFDLHGSSFDWSPVARILLVIGIVGSVIGLIVQLVSLLLRVFRGGTGAAA